MGESKDHLERRCPRLGGQISFKYCRLHGGEQLLCWKIFDCWWEFFDIVAYLREHLSDEAFGQLRNSRPKPKVTSLIELIDQAKKRTKK